MMIFFSYQYHFFIYSNFCPLQLFMSVTDIFEISLPEGKYMCKGVAYLSLHVYICNLENPSIRA